MLLFSLVPRVRNVLEVRAQFRGASDAPIAIEVHPRVRVIFPSLHEPRLHRLVARVVERAVSLQRIPNAPVEVIPVPRTAPERDMTHARLLHHHPRDRSVYLPHHLPELLPVAQVPEEVVVVVHQGDDPNDEPVKLRVVSEAIPEDRFRSVAVERCEPVAALGGDEVDRVVAVPVLEAVFSVEELVRGRGGSRGSGSGCSSG